jgi:putative transposase
MPLARRTSNWACSPNEAAIVRLVGALPLEQNEEWAVGRRYMSRETLDRSVILRPSGYPP